jgi:diguanylate cyclase (GGDEF)-like protein
MHGLALHPRSHPGVSITTRLVALVLLPVTVMCALAGSVVLSRRSTSAQAVAVAHEVTHVARLATLRDALHTQQSLGGIGVRLSQLGVTPTVASQFIGIDLTAHLVDARAKAADAVAALGSTSPVSRSDLQAVYTGLDQGALSSAQALQRLDGYIVGVGTVITRTLATLDQAGRQAQIDAPIESLVAATTLADIASAQGIDLSALWFPSPSEDAQPEATLFARLGRETANYETTLARIRQLKVPGLVQRLDVMQSDHFVAAFTQAVTFSLQSPTLVRPSVQAQSVEVASVFRGFLLRDTMLAGLSEAAAAAVRTNSAQLAAASRRAFLTWFLAGLLVSLLSIGIALLLGRSISKPIKELADHAHAVNEGRLGLTPSPRRDHGPRETRLAFRAFGDLVESLRLLDAKANALANLAFDDPVLNAPLPGRLGQSLESSVAVLSSSIMERDELQAHLTHQANHDSLTGIYNRPAAVMAIQGALDRGRRSGATTAVLFVDLDDFKAVNDRHGHEVGDEVLREIASRMTKALRSGDFVARFGGDEFIVVAQGVANISDVTDLARRIVHVVGEPMEVSGNPMRIGASIGIALSMEGPEDPIRLISRADAAMYRAKAHHGSAIEIFDTGLQDQMVRRSEIETALAAALADPGGGGLRLNYQPIVDTATQELVGVEALLRWDRAGHGQLAPDAFIPIAETSALIIDLDCWVLYRAADQLLAWSTVPALVDIPLAINISGRHLLSGKLPGHITQVLRRTGLDATRLSVEITETVLLKDLVVAASELRAVRALGVKVAIDDFGTGYTSLAHLQQLPMDTLKIDRSFTSQLSGQRGRALVRMVTVFGKSMDIPVVAEGVETAAELAALRTIGTDRMQGYLLSRPLEPAALAAWASDAVRHRTSDSA